MAMTVMAASVVVAICSTAFVGNEFSEGQVSEWMGFGHHHLVDDAAQHCPMVYNGTMSRSQCESMMNNGGMMGAMPSQGA